jgi:hypothetical protein
LRVGADALDDPLDLSRAQLDAAGLRQMYLGLLVTGFIGAFQTRQPAQRRGVAHFQPQGRIGRIVALIPARVVVVVPFQRETPKEALNLTPLAPLVDLTGAGLVGGVDPIWSMTIICRHQ